MRKRSMFVLLFLLALALPAGLPADDQSSARGIEGTWLSVVSLQDVPRIQFLHTFDKDGGTTLFLPTGPEAWVGENPSEPTVNRDDGRVACTGQWRYAGKRTFDVTMYCLLRQNPGVPPDRIRYRLFLDRGGQKLTGPFYYLYADPVMPGTPFEVGPFALESTRLGIVPAE